MTLRTWKTLWALCQYYTSKSSQICTMWRGLGDNKHPKSTLMGYLLTCAESVCNKKIKFGVGPTFSDAFSTQESSRNWITDLELNPVRRWRKTYIKELVVVTSAVIWMTEPAVMSHFKASERVPLCWVGSFGYSENYTYRKLKQLQENLRFEPKGSL